MFRNFMTYKLNEPVDLSSLPRDQFPMKTPIGALENVRYGFVSDRVEVAADNRFTVEIEEKSIPAAHLKRLAKEHEKERGEFSSRKARKEWIEAKVVELLPIAFPKVKEIHGFIKDDILFIDTANANDAEAVLHLIREANGSLLAEPYQWPRSLNTVWQNNEMLSSLKMTLGKSIKLEIDEETKGALSGLYTDYEEVEKMISDTGATITAIQLVMDGLAFTINDKDLVSSIEHAEMDADSPVFLLASARVLDIFNALNKLLK